MDDDQALRLMAAAIQGALLNHPDAGDGTTWSDHAISPNDSRHLARAVLIALENAGLCITQKPKS